jgi:hypothetical protein
VGFVVDKLSLGQIFSEYFGFPHQFSFHRLLHIHHLSSEAGTIGQLVADVSSRLSLTPPQETKKKERNNYRFVYIFDSLGSHSGIYVLLAGCVIGLLSDSENESSNFF